jgi:hypothetical protein
LPSRRTAKDGVISSKSRPSRFHNSLSTLTPPPPPPAKTRPSSALQRAPTRPEGVQPLPLRRARPPTGQAQLLTTRRLLPRAKQPWAATSSPCQRLSASGARRLTRRRKRNSTYERLYRS